MDTSNSFVIDCDECEQQHTPTCGDCLVTFLCAGGAGAVVVDLGTRRGQRAETAATG